jgi:16S rRNA (guanine527-N7)-methyltransferase
VDLGEVASAYGLGEDAAEQLRRVLVALQAEPDPHTTVPVDRAVDVHVADSLAALEVEELRRARRIADVGAGAGFPGLPLAVALPNARVDLIEAAQRKAALIGRLIEAAETPNARVVPARAEEWAGADGRDSYEAVCARAVAALPVLAEYAAPLLADGGVLVAWKGGRDKEEEDRGASAARQLGLEPGEVRAVTPYPGSRDRHLHLYRKVSPTPDGFPRRPGMAGKRPLA